MYIHLDSDEKYYYVDLVPKENKAEISFEEFENEMLVQSVRHEVYQQTKNIHVCARHC
jgi:His-Xaa-Ser system protein HxsD